ncbi:MAG: DNA repair protein RecN, partial [Opitutales bacterium]|nr:DNA repair protein RecN [Opitutales bacterium]
GRELGRELSSLANDHQVLCVTHLPQVAAMANSHFLVKKTQTNTDTSVEIAELEPDGDLRVSELARMLGDRNSASAIAHARELLKKS